MEPLWRELPNITTLIRLSIGGDKHAENELFRIAYPSLNRIAGALLRREPTAKHECTSLELIHDAYVERMRAWKGNVAERNHYLALFATAMKDRLVDRARRTRSQKRTPPTRGFPEEMATALTYEEIVALERELEKLESVDRRAAQVVHLRYYLGCSWEETAASLNSTVKLVRTDWEFVSKWLGERLGPKQG